MRTSFGKSVLLFLGIACAFFSSADADTLEEAFHSPPSSARPWVYWFWMNGNITKEGITADLQAMHDTNIGGVLIMHVGAGIPPGPVRFFSPEWRDLFQFAVAEADRLGLEVAMNACDGWTGTGGPWIKPEEAMMKLAWTETDLTGPGHKSVVLKQPKTNLQVYHDIAVLAFPTPSLERPSPAITAPKVTASDPNCQVGHLVDGDLSTIANVNPAGGFPWIQFEFKEPATVRGIQFTTQTSGNLGGNAKVQVSDDGKVFHTIGEATFGWRCNIETITISFNEASARIFRILFPPNRFRLAELQLLREGRVNNWELKAGFARRWGHGADAPHFSWRQASFHTETRSADPDWARQPGRDFITVDQVLDLTDHMDPQGKLDWDIPAGRWTVQRIGYTPTGEENGPGSIEGTGLEPDALGPNGVATAFSHFLAKLLRDVGPLAGSTLRYGHIDSWETGEQNWTKTFRREFRQRRGYDMTPYLPVMAGGRIVGGLEAAERFLWDVRRTVADLLADNYYGQMREVCHRHHVLFQTEGAGAQQFLFDPITYQQQADLPMGEFWVTEGRIRPDCKAASSVAHIFGKRFVGAESFTSGWTQARWTQHPYSLKALGDEALCQGVNRFVFHRYAMQPWIGVRPGMTMGPWGIHFERTNTWWKSGRAWMQYLTRCQSLLQRGRFVADVLYFTGEGVPNYLGSRSELTPPLPQGFDYDACNSHVLLNMVAVRNGHLVLENGMEYRVLLLPNRLVMTPVLLERVRELVEAGAVVVGPKPVRSPSLVGYPECDERVRKAADVLWGKTRTGSLDEEQNHEVDRTVGLGRVFSGLSFAEIFHRLELLPDVEHSLSESDALRYIHRRDAETDWYFMSNPARSPVEATCAFRVLERRPELWYPETGERRRPAVYRQDAGRTILPLRFEPGESFFVVFRDAFSDNAIQQVSRNNQVVLSTNLVERRTTRILPLRKSETALEPVHALYPNVNGTFTVSFWVKPSATIALPQRSDSGIAGGKGQRFVLFPEQGQIAYGEGHASAGISVGTNGICVFEHSARYFPARLVHKQSITDWVHVALVYEQNAPRLYVNGEKVATATTSTHTVHPCRDSQRKNGVEHQLFRVLAHPASIDEIKAFADHSHLRLRDWPDIALSLDLNDETSALIWKPGQYTCITAEGNAIEFEITPDELLEPLEIKGPWLIQFPPETSVSNSVVFPKLTSWTEHERPSVKYFSGTATYVKQFVVPDGLLAPNRRVYLDLGDVQVIAAIELNNKNLGTLWKPPFRVDVTKAIQFRDNTLKVAVTNLWPNRLIGDEQFPTDASYGPVGVAGRILQWPEWLQQNSPRPEPRRHTFASWKHYEKDSPLLTSGLLGPVTLKSALECSLNP